MKSSMTATRLMARRDALSVGIRLLTRNGHDWSSRYPLILRAVNKLKVRSCLIDGEAVCCTARSGQDPRVRPGESGGLVWRESKSMP